MCCSNAVTNPQRLIAPLLSPSHSHCSPSRTDAPQGSVDLVPEDEEDMWHVYNLISEGDEVQAMTDRKVHTTSSTGTTSSFRVQLKLTINVKRVSCVNGLCAKGRL